MALDMPVTHMRAAVLGGVGKPLKIESVPVPQPRDGEVLIKVNACGVCHTDLHVMKGEVAFPTPCVLGHEISGRVAEVGAGVEGFSTGDPVVSSFIMPCGTCYYCVRGQDDLCEKFFAYNRLKGTLYDGETRLWRDDGTPLWMYSMGGLAEYAVVPATDVFHLPPEIPMAEAAILGCAIFTAYGALRNGAGLVGGESVAVVATGGVGSNIIQIARAFGALPIIAVDVTDEKLEAARRLGATHTVNSRQESAVERIREITGGRGVDVAFEALGRPETFATALDSVRDGGRAVMVGIAPAGVTAPIEITRLVRRKIAVTGSYGGRARTDMPAVVSLARQGRVDVRAPITRRYPLEEADRAYKALDAGEIVGRAIVVMEA